MRTSMQICRRQTKVCSQESVQISSFLKYKRLLRKKWGGILKFYIPFLKVYDEIFRILEGIMIGAIEQNRIVSSNISSNSLIQWCI